MSEATLQTGKRGEGKGLAAARMMTQYLRDGRTVATNVDIKLDGMPGLPVWSETRAYRLPDHPKASDLEALPLGNPDPTNEERNGLLVLDEISTFLNSRSWQEKDRKALLDWLAHSRKFGWDLFLMSQHPRQVDAQLRESLCELHGIAKRMDKIEVPFLSSIYRAFSGKPLRFPKIHVITLRYGFGGNAPKAGGFWFFGRDYYAAYDTLQVIHPESGQQGLSTYLPLWYLKGRYMTKAQIYRGMMIVSVAMGLMVGAVAASVYHYVYQSQKNRQTNPIEKVETEVTVSGVVSDGGPAVQLLLSNGQVVRSSSTKYSVDGVIYEVAGKYYRSLK